MGNRSRACIGGVLFFYLLLGASAVKSPVPLAPALYIFGDSHVDAGNSNHLSSIFRADNPPYGVDFPGGPTGRFTNGKTMADFIAESLGLPLVPADLSLPPKEKNETTTGINFSSGSAGILPETGTLFGVNWNLETQINMFEDTVNRNLPEKFQSPEELSQYLSKCIFLVDIGSNDIINPLNHQNDSHEDFAKLLIKTLSDHFQRLYDLGARKFVVFEIGPIGCSPAMTADITQQGQCNQEINDAVVTYNKMLSSLLQSLNLKLKGSNFSQAKIYALWMKATEKAGKLKLTKDLMRPCCFGPNNGTLPCTASQPSCKNANELVYFDGFHPTEEVYSKIAEAVFSDSWVCTPASIKDLATA